MCIVYINYGLLTQQPGYQIDLQRSHSVPDLGIISVSVSIPSSGLDYSSQRLGSCGRGMRGQSSSSANSIYLATSDVLQYQG